jgi:hypothetical protein
VGGGGGGGRGKGCQPFFDPFLFGCIFVLLEPFTLNETMLRVDVLIIIIMFFQAAFQVERSYLSLFLFNSFTVQPF